jgi:hypothetical protein
MLHCRRARRRHLCLGNSSNREGSLLKLAKLAIQAASAFREDGQGRPLAQKPPSKGYELLEAGSILSSQPDVACNVA